MPLLDVRFAHPDLLCLSFVTLSHATWVGTDLFNKMFSPDTMSNYFIIFPISSEYFRIFPYIFKFVENMVRTDNSVDTGSSFFSVES